MPSSSLIRSLATSRRYGQSFASALQCRPRASVSDRSPVSTSGACTYLRRYLGVIAAAGERYGLPVGFDLYPGCVYGHKGAIHVQRFSCPDMRCRRIKHAFGCKGEDLVGCPVPITAHVDARPIVDFEPAWLVAMPAPYDESVFTKAQWQERFILPMRAGLVCLGTVGGIDPEDL